MPFLVKQNKDLNKNALFQNALKMLEQLNGVVRVPKNKRTVNLKKIVESFKKC